MGFAGWKDAARKVARVTALIAIAGTGWLAATDEVSALPCLAGTQSGGADVWNTTSCRGTNRTFGRGVGTKPYVDGLLGSTDWVYLGKVDGNETTPSLTMTGLFGRSGTWTINNYDPSLTYALTLWGGGHYANYILGGSTGGWTMNAFRNGGGQIPGISGASLAYVPLPGAAWLMLAGLGGLGLVARRRIKTGV
jgi:hypothetical protein